MNSDEQILYDPNDEIHNLDATEVTNRSTNNSTNTSNSRGLVNSWFILEPAVFLLFLARYMSDSVYQNQILYQTCISIFQYNITDCQPLLGISRETEEAKKIELIVQPYVSRIFMTRSLLESIIPAFISMFIGPWSDKYGRRPIVLSTFTGYFVSCLILTILSIIATSVTLNPWIVLLSSVPSVLSGGTCALITGIYCYISDVAKEKARATRMVLNEASLCAGIVLGNIACGYIYVVTNTITIFVISTILMVLALAYVYIFVEESLQPDQIHSGSKIREFFRFDLVKDLVVTCLERRPNFNRAIIWLIMVSLTITIFVQEGEYTVTYLFLREKFGWTAKDFSFFNAIRLLTQIVGSIIGMLLFKKIFKFSIITMAMLSMASCVLESTVRSTAVYWWEMYLGVALGCMRGILGPMSRAILTHMAPPTDVGKIFALTTSLESLSPLGASPLYTIVYDNTLNFYPGLFNFISACLFLLCFTLNSAIYGIQVSLRNAEIYQTIGS